MRRCKKVDKRPLSLLEVLVVLALISLLGGVLSFGIRGVLREASFRSDAEKVKHLLSVSQEMMLFAKSDVALRFQKEKGVVSYSLSGENLPQGVPLSFFASFDDIKELYLVQEGGKIGLPFTLFFLSSGSVMTEGNLFIQGQAGSYSICLPGIIAPFALKKGERECPQKKIESSLYDETMREAF